MLNKLTLKNFRQHTDKTLDLNPGVTVIRGHNEAGKTTIFEAVMYALGGTKACRNGDITSWGAADNKVKVTLSGVFDGQTLTVSRGKSGAEIKSGQGEVLVTGQGEVTRYVEAALNVPKSSGSMLMFSGQGDIRGLLSQGGAVAVRAIESLAGLDDLDRVIELIQTKLATGNVQLFADRLQASEASLSELEAAAPDFTELNRLRSELQQVEAQIAEREQGIATLQQGRMQDPEYTQAFQKYELYQTKRVAQANKLESLREQLERVQRELAQLEGLHIERPAAEALHHLEADLSRLRKVADTQQVYALWLDAKSEVVESVWEGDAASLAADIRTQESQLESLNRQRQGVAERLAVARTRIVQGTTCGYCGQDLSNVPEVVARNQQTQHEVTELEAERAQLDAAAATVQSYLKQLRQVPQSSKATRLASRYPDLFSCDETASVPANVAWVGPLEFEENADQQAAAIQADLANMRKQSREADLHEGRISGLRESLAGVKKEVVRQEGVVNSYGNESDLRTWLESINKWDDQITALQSQRALLIYPMPELRSRVQQLSGGEEYFLRSLETARKTVAADRQVLEEVAFNNSLLKSVRAAKPVVANHLWNTVLGAVSYYFSLLRGTASKVERGTGGFVVDGKPVDSLSGSTLDILGLAIRIALTKTFVPSTDFLLLDEPFAACDEQRQAACLGFLASVGFSQILIVTHEDASESFADHLIHL